MAGTDFLDMYSDADLQRVLDERQEQKQKRIIPPMPDPRHTKAAFKKILIAAAEILEGMKSDDYSVDNNDATHLYEDVMGAIYGAEVWDYINAFCD